MFSASVAGAIASYSCYQFCLYFVFHFPFFDNREIHEGQWRTDRNLIDRAWPSIPLQWTTRPFVCDRVQTCDMRLIHTSHAALLPLNQSRGGFAFYFHISWSFKVAKAKENMQSTLGLGLWHILQLFSILGFGREYLLLQTFLCLSSRESYAYKEETSKMSNFLYCCLKKLLRHVLL